MRSAEITPEPAADPVGRAIAAHTARRNAAIVRMPRAAVVDFDPTLLRTPLDHRLRIWGQGIGGYAAAHGSVSRYAVKDAAETAAAIWIETGVYPAQQSRVSL